MKGGIYSMSKNCIIIAPHCDDEIIGCFEVLNNTNNNVTIIYDAETDTERRKECLKLKDFFSSVKHQIFHVSFPSSYLNGEVTIYAPDPTNELHPLHREWGCLAEKLARDGNDVIFYTTNMNVPYIHEVKEWKKKEEVLNQVYPSQKDLWLYEKKYIFFEGRTQWIF